MWLAERVFSDADNFCCNLTHDYVKIGFAVAVAAVLSSAVVPQSTTAYNLNQSVNNLWGVRVQVLCSQVWYLQLGSI